MIRRPASVEMQVGQQKNSAQSDRDFEGEVEGGKRRNSQLRWIFSGRKFLTTLSPPATCSLNELRKKSRFLPFPFREQGVGPLLFPARVIFFFADKSCGWREIGAATVIRNCDGG